MKWTQEKINHWSVQTFGKHNALGRAIRMNKEAAELSADFFRGDNIAKEAADVAIILCQVMLALGIVTEFVDDGENHYEETESEGTNVSLLLVASGDLISALYHNEDKEAGRIARVIMDRVIRLCDEEGVHLKNTIDEKMDVNEKRSWAKSADGSFQHV